MNFKNLKLDRIIVHEVLLASDLEANRQPALSDDFIEIDPAGEQLLCKRLVDALGSESHSVELAVELDEDGSSFQLATQLLDAKKAAFIKGSQELAKRLTQAQVSGAVKAGIAVIVTGSMGSDGSPARFVVILKAESDAGFIKQKGPKGVSLAFITDLVLGAQQRLYKVGCFVEKVRAAAAGARSKADFDVVVYDHLMSSTGKSEAARYFYGTFLGCRLADSASRLTKIFFDETRSFIDSLRTNPKQRMELRTHLVSYMKSEEPHISTRHFAERYLPNDLHQSYDQAMRRARFPARNVSKDNKHIRRSLQLRRVVFTSKVRIVASEEDFGDKVKILDEANGWTNVKIAGTLEFQK